MLFRKYFLTTMFTLMAMFSIANIASASYLYESPLGYSLQCPEKPVGVIPASAFYQDDRKGEVLVFANDGYKLNRA